MFTGDGSLVFFSESAGLGYISVSFVHRSLDRDLTFSVLVAENGTASEGMVKSISILFCRSYTIRLCFECV